MSLYIFKQTAFEKKTSYMGKMMYRLMIAKHPIISWQLLPINYYPQKKQKLLVITYSLSILHSSLD